MGEKKIISEEEIKDWVLPNANDVFGIAIELLGFDRLLVKCQDCHERPCRIREKMEKESMDKAERHCFSFAKGFPIRQTRRRHMEIQKESSCVAENERIPHYFIGG